MPGGYSCRRMWGVDLSVKEFFTRVGGRGIQFGWVGGEYKMGGRVGNYILINLF